MSFYESFAEISSDVLIAKANHFIRSVIAATITHPSWAVTVQLFEGKSKELQINKLQLLFLNLKTFFFLLWETKQILEKLTDHLPHTPKSKLLSFEIFRKCKWYIEFFYVSPINSNFQISSLADFCFLSINSSFSQEIHLYSFETEDGWVCAWPWEEELNIKVQPLTMPQIILCELNKSSLTQLCICERGCW